MRVNPRVVFTFALLGITAGMGALGFIWGSTLAQKALAGISQPEMGLSRRSASSRTSSAGADAVTKPDGQGTGGTIAAASEAVDPETDIVFLSEEALLQTVQEIQQQSSQPSQSGDRTTPDSSTLLLAQFPFTAQNQGVMLEIRSARAAQDVVILDTYLRNDSTETVRFLYSNFLEVTNEQNQPLTAFVEGLPGELSAMGEMFSGEIRIPQNLIGSSKTLTVKLADYPDRTVTLEVIGIPIP
ncbi:MAG: hypothetical protein ACO4AI_10060 [Prochlorothrix sp.]|nr:hypothetical protein [Prochlorothrix sp.]